MKDRKNCIVRVLCHYTRAFRGVWHSICNCTCRVPKNIPIVFNNGWNYAHHFIIKELGEEFKKQFNCLGENTIKYVTFTISTEEEVTKID